MAHAGFQAGQTIYREQAESCVPIHLMQTDWGRLAEGVHVYISMVLPLASEEWKHCENWEKCQKYQWQCTLFSFL